MSELKGAMIIGQSGGPTSVINASAYGAIKAGLDSDAITAVYGAANGKLFGAVTNQTIADYYAKNGFEIERKKIEISGLTIKQTGNYKITVHLYESATAEVKLAVKPQEAAEAKKETKKAEKKAEVKEEAPAEEAKAE